MLDSMHEGVLVAPEEPEGSGVNRIWMLNKSALKILKTFLDWKDDEVAENQEKHSIFSKARFYQVKVEDVNGISCFLTEPQPFSLEQIMLSQKDEKTQRNRIY